MNILKGVWTFSLQKLYHHSKSIFSNNSKLKIYEVRGGDCKGVQLKLNSTFVNQYKDIISGTYENFLMNALKNKVNVKGKTIWDIGAHIGFQTFSFARNAGDTGHVISFEPNPNNFEILTENIRINKGVKNVQPVMLAVSNQKTVMPFKISKYTNHPATLGGHLSDIIPPEEKNVYKDFKTIDVNVNSIDNLVYVENYKWPDIIKIDIEGAELNALQGTTKLMSSQNKPVLVIEIHTISMMFHVLQFLLQFNYKVEIIDDHVEFFTKNIICTPNNF